MRNLSFQISSQIETFQPLRDLNAERGKFGAAVAAWAEQDDYCSKVLHPRQRESARKEFGLRVH